MTPIRIRQFFDRRLDDRYVIDAIKSPKQQAPSLQQNPFEILLNEETTQPCHVFQFPDQKMLSCVSLVEVTPPLTEFWPSLEPKFRQLTHLYNNPKTIFFCEQAQLEQPEIEIDLSNRQAQLGFTGPSNLYAAINGLIELLRNGETQKDVTVFMVISGKVENQNRVEEELATSLNAYKAITSQFNISLHVLAIGQDFPHSTLELIKQALSQRRDKNILFQIQVAPSSKNYAEILRKKFAKIEECLTAKWIRIVGHELPTFPGATKCSQYINSPYIVTPISLSELKIRRNGSVGQILSQTLVHTLDDAIGICKTIIATLKGEKHNVPGYEQTVIQAKQYLMQLVKELLPQLDEQQKFAFDEAVDGFNTLIRKSTNCVIDRALMDKWALTTFKFTYFARELRLLLQKSNINLEKSGQDRSVVNFVNQKDVLSDEEYLHILHITTEPQQALQYFPLVGQGLFIPKVNDVQKIWYYTEIKLPICHSIFDTASIYYKSNEFQKIEFEGGFDIVNVVLPLFSPVDKDLAPLLKSKFFDTIMTLQVLKTADIYHPEAMATLLSRYLVHLMSKPSSTWRTEQMDLIFNTFKLKYDDYEPFNTRIKQLLSNKPYEAFFNLLDKDAITPPTMITLLLFIIQRSKPEDIKKNFNYIITVIVYASFANKTYAEAEAVLSSQNWVLTMKEEATIEISKLIEKTPKTLYQFQEEIYKACLEFDFTPYILYIDPEIQSNLSVSSGSFDFGTLRMILKFFSIQLTLESLILSIVYQMHKYSTNYQRLTSDFSDHSETLKYHQRNLIKKRMRYDSITKSVLEQVLLSTTLIPSNIGFSQQLEQAGSNTLSKDLEEQPSQYQPCPATNNINNSCTSPDCYFYMKPMNSMKFVCWCSEYLSIKEVSTDDNQISQQQPNFITKQAEN